MFKKSRRKIVVSIMTILVVVWVGMLSMIYAFSYIEMTKQNERMLKAHIDMYNLPPAFDMAPYDRPMPDMGEHGFRPGFTEKPIFKLTTFYTIAFSYEGKVLDIKNDSPTVYSNDDLVSLAQNIVAGDVESGRKDNFSFYRADRNGYMLVAFMDNTVVNENAMMLFRFTLIFGAIALIIFYFLSGFLAKRIVKPLEESYQKQKQFISDAGHELKTPVSVVSANAELLTREIGENQWLSNIQYENERMGVLVGQLLDLARTENVKSQMEQINFSRLVDGEVLPFESVAFEKGMLLSSDIEDGVSVEGNSTQLKQLISILLDNAIEHSNEQDEIVINVRKDHRMVCLQVINRGDEIPKEQREQIFERFYRVDTVRNGEDKHYGLGLSIAKAIVTAHKGQIKVQCYNGLVEFKVQIPSL